MAFITDKEELKPGLIIFRRADVDHRNWYSRSKVPGADRYKTVSLKTADIHLARDRAFDQDADLRFRIKHEIPIFDRPFSEIAKEYVETQRKRANMGEISQDRIKKLESVIKNQLNPYVGTTQISLIGQDRWTNYPTWRRAHAKGRLRTLVSDSTIRFEMSIFGAVMNYAAKRNYIAASRRFEGRPALQTMRRDAFTLNEYRALHTRGRAWVNKAKTESSRWYRTVAYYFVLIMCNTGMRPSEAKNLRWRDINPGKDKAGNDLVILAVRGKRKSRQLVAPPSVGHNLDHIRAISKATAPDDRVFTTETGAPTTSLYKALIEDLLTTAKLRDGPSGIPRSTYSFRHTYATFRLSEGVDVYLLAQQMGTSVKMIEDHYGHVDAVNQADLVLQGMGSWEPPEQKPVDSKRANKKKDRTEEATQKYRRRVPAKAKTGHRDPSASADTPPLDGR